MDKNNANNVVEFEGYEKEGGSGIGGKILAVSLGAVIGVGATIGGLAAIGAWALKRPINKVENVVQKFVPNLDLSEYLTDEYYNNTVLNLLSGIKSAISDISAGKAGFAALAKISPTAPIVMPIDIAIPIAISTGVRPETPISVATPKPTTTLSHAAELVKNTARDASTAYNTREQ